MGAKSAISSKNLGDIEAQAAITRPFVTRVSVTTILDRAPDDCPLLLKSALDCADHPSGAQRSMSSSLRVAAAMRPSVLANAQARSKRGNVEQPRDPDRIS